jgi:hypothetical protein
MSTAKQGDSSALRRWTVPAVCVLAAGGYLAVFLATGQVATAIWSAAIMLLYGAILVIFSRRSEIAAILRDDGRDERRAAIQLRATAVMGLVVGVFALTMAFVELARGHGPGDWGTICLVGGASFLAAVVFFARRG